MSLYHCIVLYVASVLHDGMAEMQYTRFSLYGIKGLARNPSEGTYRGIMTELRCSSLCAININCMGYQIDSATQSGGECSTFIDYTLSDFLVARPNVRYYEKRQCEANFPVEATVMHVQYLTVNFFRGQVVKSFRFIQENNVITDVVRLGQNPISDMYPGYETSVDAALEINHTFPPRIILIKGTTETCYERDPDELTFTPCNVTSYFTAFFTLTGLTCVDAAVAYDDARNTVHVFANGEVHILEFNVGTDDYEWLSKHPLNDPDVSNPWTNAVPSLTSIYRLTTTSFYLFDKAKYVRYDVIKKQITSSPLILCNE